MLLRLATVTATVLVAVGTASPALADPRPGRSPGRTRRRRRAAPPPDTGAVASEVPGIAKTPDGRTLTVVAKDETQLPVAPLTTSLSSRDWLVGATFTGTTTGEVSRRHAGGRLPDRLRRRDGQGQAERLDRCQRLGNASLGATGFNAARHIAFPIQGQIEVEPRPGTITNVVVDKKSFKGTSARVTLRDVHIKVDNCVGASSLRSYAVLTSSGTDDDDIVAYYGVTKVF